MGSLSGQPGQEITVNAPEPAKQGVPREDGTIELSTQLWETSLPLPASEEPSEVDARDAGTPDEWIKRHADMIRLTGRHPFNAETPMHKLQAMGWITPAPLHVIRNHGSVPKLDRATHRVQLEGFPIGAESSMSVQDLVDGKFGPAVTFPVTFICCGLRRMEMNMCKKTVGFHWGAGGVGNSVWTGVRLCDILRALGITRPSKEHRFVHFEGPAGELPKGENGTYGTSIDIGWALDRERDVLLVFKQNGEWLSPDHGAPLRTLLPGCIGGRMIKWLSKMWVSDKESENHYHYFDNKVLPSHVDSDLAMAEGWWYKPEYIINHLQIQSAMFEPRHMSVIDLSAHTVKVSGYAFSGNGAKIIRVEISVDAGKSWEMTELDRPEDAIAEARGTDKHWCWTWWETEVDALRLLHSGEICCRAVDSNQNTQPAELSWSLMGQNNNCIFRVKVHAFCSSAGKQSLWFEHPAVTGSDPSGWMTDVAGQFKPEISSEAAAGRHGVAPLRPAVATCAN